MGHQGKAELDSASNAGHAELMRAFFGPEGYGGSVWGTEESLKSIRKNDITQFYETYFKASNMVLSIASDLDESVVAGHVNKYLGGIETGPVRKQARAPSRSRRKGGSSGKKRPSSRIWDWVSLFPVSRPGITPLLI